LASVSLTLPITIIGGCVLIAAFIFWGGFVEEARNKTR
jgi:hypothetical protein